MDKIFISLFQFFVAFVQYKLLKYFDQVYDDEIPIWLGLVFYLLIFL